VADHNTPNIGICLVGHLSRHPATPQQMTSLKGLIAHLNKELGKDLIVKGHRDFNPTECPGKTMKLPLR
jgi:hypothetical protein